MTIAVRQPRLPTTRRRRAQNAQAVPTERARSPVYQPHRAGDLFGRVRPASPDIVTPESRRSTPRPHSVTAQVGARKITRTRTDATAISGRVPIGDPERPPCRTPPVPGRLASCSSERSRAARRRSVAPLGVADRGVGPASSGCLRGRRWMSAFPHAAVRSVACSDGRE